jgi:predicted acyl esterase
MAGCQQLVRGEPFRAKFRESFTAPRPLVPGEPAKLEFTMPDVFHRFAKGHRVMVQVQSTWFPLVARNPQKFCDVGKATDADYVAATQRVFHAPERASCLRVRVR